MLKPFRLAMSTMVSFVCGYILNQQVRKYSNKCGRSFNLLVTDITPKKRKSVKIKQQSNLPILIYLKLLKHQRRVKNSKCSKIVWLNKKGCDVGSICVMQKNRKMLEKWMLAHQFSLGDFSFMIFALIYETHLVAEKSTIHSINRKI